MEFLDDLSLTVFGALYDLRVPVAIGSVVAVVAMVVLGRRRGWFAAARRHPGRASAVTAIALAIGLPLTWYLVSPIFVRSVLVEPEPVGASASSTPGPSPSVSLSPEPSIPVATTPAGTPEPTPTWTPEPTPFEPVTLARGEFHGSDDFHFGRGTATIIEVEPGRYRLRLDDFSVRNGPDLYVYLSPIADGYARGALELGKLKATDGSFGYDLPPEADPSEYASAVIWCKQFSHLFATAPLAGA